MYVARTGVSGARHLLLPGARVVQQEMLLAMSMFTAVLPSMLSPLEMCACIAVVDVSEAKKCFHNTAALSCFWCNIKPQNDEQQFLSGDDILLSAPNGDVRSTYLAWVWK